MEVTKQLNAARRETRRRKAGSECRRRAGEGIGDERMKIMWIDTETTGLTEKSDLIQLSGIIEIDGEVKEEFDVYSRPFPDTLIEAKALEVNGRTLEEINSFQSPEKALAEFEAVLSKYVDKYNKDDKFVIAGHNVQFDLNKLQSFYKKNDNQYLGSWIRFNRKFCTLSAVEFLQIAGKIPCFKSNNLGSCCEYFGIVLENAHNSMSDIRATRELGKRLIEIVEGTSNEI